MKPEIKFYQIKNLLKNNGNEGEGFGWAGQVIGLINDVPPVQELFNEMISTVEQGKQRLINILETTKNF